MLDDSKSYISKNNQIIFTYQIIFWTAEVLASEVQFLSPTLASLHSGSSLSSCLAHSPVSWSEPGRECIWGRKSMDHQAMCELKPSDTCFLFKILHKIRFSQRKLLKSTSNKAINVFVAEIVLVTFSVSFKLSGLWFFSWAGS